MGNFAKVSGSLFLAESGGRCFPKIARGVEHGLDDAGAHGVVAKAFARFAACCPAGDPFAQDGEDFWFGDIFFVEAGDTRALAVAAGVEVVATHGFAHEADFGEHGAAAAVGAAVGAQNDVLFGQAVFCHDFVHMVEELGQEAFGFGHGQRAGGQGDAGHAVFALFAHFVVDETVFAGDFFDFGLVAGGHAGHDEVLVGGEAEVAFVDFGDFAQAGFERAAGRVGDAAVFDEEGEVPFFVFALHPADAVAARGKFVGADGLEFRAHAVFHFSNEYFRAHALEGVAGFGGFAVAPVAPVALHGNDGGGAVEHFVEPDEAEFAGGVGVGFGVAVLHGEAAAHEYVEAGEFAVSFNGDEV